jgi:catechol 2,3-dioxygenase-like lactoylglutathione lyase family enzyme
MAKPAKFAHVVYMTRRYEAMIAWYRDVFEAEIVNRDPALAFLTYDDEHHRFAFANLDLLKPDGGGPDDRGQIGVNHVAYTYASVADLLHTYERLKAAGIHPYWPVHHGTTLSLYYADPDGNRMELQVDACNAEEGRAMMAATDNPVGCCPIRRCSRRGGETGRRRRNCWPSRRASLRRSRRRMG